MALFWFLAGMLTAVAILILLLPLLRAIPRFTSLPSLGWPAAAGAASIVIVVAAVGIYQGLSHSEFARQSPARIAANGFRDAVNASGGAANIAPKSGAASMSDAVASLESRLAKGRGTSDDWELLAKSFEFLGRPEDASRARAHQLPPLASEAGETAAVPTAPAPAPAPASAGAAVSGEVSLAAALRTKAPAGATLYIVAKSVDSPGIPLAVFRGSVGTWPVKFTLDDTQSMIPGRNLSSAGRVTIEARISLSGQPMPAAGDLEGASAVINPAERQPLRIVIDHVIS